jgi:peptidoglycan hydrolase CwlO-like protein
MTLLWLLAAYAAAVTPVQKVITMMEDMAAKGKAEKEAEIATYQAYMKWCDKTSFEKSTAIRDGKLAVEQGTAAAGKASADAEAAADKIVELNGNIKSWATEKAEAIKTREVEQADYEAEHTEFTENIDALNDAMSAIAAATQPVSALIQDANSDLAASWEALTRKLPANEKHVFTSLLQTEELSAPAGNAYDSGASDGVQDAVGKLKERIEGKRADLEKEETDHKYAFDMLVGQLDLNTEQANNEIDEKTQEKAQRLADFESYTQEVETTSATLKTDEKYFADLEAQCTTKTEEFEARQKMREEELEAIAKAIDVMSGSTVSGAADEHLPSFIQTRKSFAFLRAVASSERPNAVHRAIIFLQGRAKKAESRILANLAAKVTEGGPFDKVVEMIKDLIEKLSTEAAEEADQKSWCDAELKSNKETRDEKTEEVNRLTARSDMLHAQLAQLTSEMETLAEQISELNLALKEATEDRAAEKAANDKAIADAKAAIPAVRSALKVLKDFYAKAASATALVQQPSPAGDAPGSWDSAYTGMGGSSKGVLGMLEVILADFVRLEQETSSTEAEAQSAFDKFSSDSTADIDAKTATSKEKETLKLSKTRDLEDTGKDLKSTQKELDAALAYHDELKPSCVDAGVSFSERSQRRQEEIESLQEALKILGDE